MRVLCQEPLQCRLRDWGALACCVVACSSNPTETTSAASTATVMATASFGMTGTGSSSTSASSQATSTQTSMATAQDSSGAQTMQGMSSIGAVTAMSSGTGMGGGDAGNTATAAGGGIAESTTGVGGAGGGTLAASSGSGGMSNDDWIDLFNGMDFAGWVAHDGGRGDASSLPIEDVFQVVDGEIHVYRGATNGSTQVFGNLRNETMLSGNYVLHVEYRWGTSKFAPRATADRDAGILFHITGSDVSKVFPDSLEMQIGDSQLGGDYVTGDLWVLGVPTVAEVMVDGELRPVGDVGGDSVPHYTDAHAENPRGEWNVCEIAVNGSESAVYTLNGVEVHRLYNFTYGGEPLDHGFVSVQAEWAEIFYRNIRYRQQ